MASTVKVPLLGQQSKGTVVGVTIGGFAVAGYLIYRSNKKKQQAAAAAAAQQQQAQASASYGYGQSLSGYYGYGMPASEGSSGGFYPSGYYGYGTPIGGGVPNATNAQWAQAAINQLEGEGYNPQTVSAALGAYELGQPVTPAQVTIIQSAIGIEGYPPQEGPNGYPPAIHAQGTPGGGGGGGQGGGGGGGDEIDVPNVVGDRAEEGLSDLRAAGFRAKTSPPRNPTRLYRITSQSPAGGTHARRGSLVTVRVQAESRRTAGINPGAGRQE